MRRIIAIVIGLVATVGCYSVASAQVGQAAQLISEQSPVSVGLMLTACTLVGTIIGSWAGIRIVVGRLEERLSAMAERLHAVEQTQEECIRRQLAGKQR